MSTIPGIPYGPTPRAAQYAYALTQWDLIVVHDTGHHGENWSIASAADEARYAANRTDDRKNWTTCHAYIDVNGPLGSLSLDLQAWAARSWANGLGVHLEMCGEDVGSGASVPAATIAHTAALARRIADLKGIPLVKLTPEQLATAYRTGARVRGFCGHYDLTRAAFDGNTHSDPGPGFDWSSFMALVGAPTMGGTSVRDSVILRRITDGACVWRMGAFGQPIANVADLALVQSVIKAAGGDDAPKNVSVEAWKFALGTPVSVLVSPPPAAVAMTPADLDNLATKVADVLAVRLAQ